MTRATPPKPRIAILGAGPGGLCMAVRLREAGIEDFVVLEKSAGVGGTWHHNRYPGCACDIPSHLYSFSFETKCDWPRPYAPQPAILEYLQHCAEKYGVLPHCRFGAGVRSAVWNESEAHWRLELENGDAVEAQVVVSAIGMFNELAEPAIPGLEDFAGARWHSARWNWEHDLRGERVAVVGSAASAVQFVPEIVKQAGQVHLFQRSANWVNPKEDDPYTEEQLEEFRRNPAALEQSRKDMYQVVDEGMTFQNPELLAGMEVAGLAALEVVEDPVVREKLTPKHPFGCKRPLMSNDYYPAFNRPNLELVTDPIERITKDSVITADGAERHVDTLILATGFCAHRYLSALDVRGRGGRHIEDAWNDGAHAYLGITTAGFPNLFMLYGPNTNNGSILSMIELQADYTLRMIQRLEAEGLAWVDVKPEPEQHYNEGIQRAISGVSVWNAGCNGYYRSASGRIVTQWPHSMSEFERRTSEASLDDFEITRRSV